MSNDTAIVRAFKLWAKISMMIVDGKRDAREVANVLQDIVDGTGKLNVSHTRLVNTVCLYSAKEVTIAEAGDVFTGHLDPDFKKMGTNVARKDTREAGVSIYEQVKDGDYRTLFGSIGDPRSLCLTQGQIADFCRDYRRFLRDDGYDTFFLFEVNGELFVALVCVTDGHLRALVYRFDDNHVWGSNKRQLVVPQQTI